MEEIEILSTEIKFGIRDVAENEGFHCLKCGNEYRFNAPHLIYITLNDIPRYIASDKMQSCCDIVIPNPEVFMNEEKALARINELADKFRKEGYISVALLEIDYSLTRLTRVGAPPKNDLSQRELH